MLAAAWSGWIVLISLVLFLLWEAGPAVRAAGWRTWLGREWQPQAGAFGLLPLLAGTGWVTVLAALVALPCGYGAAVYVAEFMRPGQRRWWQAIWTLAGGIPSVVYGYAGSVWLVPAVAAALGLGSGYTALTAGLVVACMIVPIHVSLSVAALRAVPDDVRDASLALGATTWETACLVVWPAARRGLAAAATAACARAFGETMAVLMLAGNTPRFPGLPAEPVRTLTAAIAAEMGEAVSGSLHYHALFVAALMLLAASAALQWLMQGLLRPNGAR